MTRNLNSLLLDYTSMDPYGGLAFVLKGLEIKKRRLGLRRR